MRLFAVLIAIVVQVPMRWWAPAGSAALMHAQGAEAPAGPPETYEGTLLVIWGDPQAGSHAAVDARYLLALPDGRQLPLQMSGHERGAFVLFGKPVVVRGRAAASAPAAAGVPDRKGIVVDSIAPGRGMPALADRGHAAMSGTRKVLYILLKFADDEDVPHPPSFYTTLTNPDTAPDGSGIPATINGFFKKTSNNLLAWDGAVGGAGGIGAPDGWIALPEPKSSYADCDFGVECLDLGKITGDSVAAAHAAGIAFTDYDTLNFVYSNDLDCCAWGGGFEIEGKVYGVTWGPPWAQETRVYAHELGHSLGLPHSGWTYYAYDSPWDVMSEYSDAVSMTCGSYASRNSGGIVRPLTCREPGNGYIAAHRDYLGWIPPANIVTTGGSAPVMVTLEGTALPMGTTPKMIKICLPGFSCAEGSGRYFTVEARTKGTGTDSLFDHGIPDEGVLIHDVQFDRPAIGGPCYFNAQSGWAVPIDTTPGDYSSSTCTFASGKALYNAQLTPGHTYTNDTFGFMVSVLSRSGSTFLVSVETTTASDIALDSPANGATVGRPFTVQGWATNRRAATGTGVDAVHVYAAPADGGAAIFLGVASYGMARNDVGEIFGAQFTNCGFTLSAGAGLAPGGYTVTAYAHNATTGSFDATQSAAITVTAPASRGLLAIDTPAPSSTVTSAFEVGGWALDLAATSGTGVDSVRFYVFPNGGADPGVFIGAGSYGLPRTDVGAIFGSRFNDSGFHFTISGLGPGNFVLGVYARSTVTGTFSIVRTLRFTVSATALLSIDAPSAEMTIATATFAVSGWAIDRGDPAASDPGVDALHIYAYPNPGSGEPAIFLGVASSGIARSDLAARYGNRYLNSGFVLHVDASEAGLSPGIYSLVVFAHSTVTNSFNNLAVVRVTIQ